MRSRYRIHEPDAAHFITATIIEWLPVFTTEEEEGNREDGGRASSRLLRCSHPLLRALPSAQGSAHPRLGHPRQPLPRHRRRSRAGRHRPRFQTLHRPHLFPLRNMLDDCSRLRVGARLHESENLLATSPTCRPPSSPTASRSLFTSMIIPSSSPNALTQLGAGFECSATSAQIYLEPAPAPATFAARISGADCTDE